MESRTKRIPRFLIDTNVLVELVFPTIDSNTRNPQKSQALNNLLQLIKSGQIQIVITNITLSEIKNIEKVEQYCKSIIKEHDISIEPINDSYALAFVLSFLKNIKKETNNIEYISHIDQDFYYYTIDLTSRIINHNLFSDGDAVFHKSEKTDAYFAALAAMLNVPLITDNTKDFDEKTIQMIQDITIQYKKELTSDQFNFGEGGGLILGLSSFTSDKTLNELLRKKYVAGNGKYENLQSQRAFRTENYSQTETNGVLNFRKNYNEYLKKSVFILSGQVTTKLAQSQLDFINNSLDSHDKPTFINSSYTSITTARESIYLDVLFILNNIINYEFPQNKIFATVPDNCKIIRDKKEHCIGIKIGNISYFAEQSQSDKDNLEVNKLKIELDIKHMDLGELLCFYFNPNLNVELHEIIKEQIITKYKDINDLPQYLHNYIDSIDFNRYNYNKERFVKNIFFTLGNGVGGNNYRLFTNTHNVQLTKEGKVVVSICAKQDERGDSTGDEFC